jgi:hypothetical protein
LGFGPYFDSISFNILGRHERRKAASLEIANVLSAILVEDFTWFFIDGDYHLIVILRKDYSFRHQIGQQRILVGYTYLM